MRPDNATTGILVMDDNPFVRPLNSQSSPSRYSARRMAKPITFFNRSPQASTVFVTGDFNEWHPTSHPMQRQPDADWLIQIPLPHGHHRYLLLVDGKPSLDPRAMGTAEGPHGEKVSLVAVS
jgi:1,4-alpha-glucan branching enzyme